jgi:predicted nucleic acid-binding protein
VTTTVRYLVDASAITRMTHADVAEVLVPLCDAGVVGTCGPVELDLAAAVRDLADLPRVTAYRRAAFVWLPADDADLCRAVQVAALLAEDGLRLPGWSPLLVAAVAERHQVIVLHYDPAFDAITKVTGQAVQWVVPEGSPPAAAGTR